MTQTPVRLLAEVHLLSPEAGGRTAVVKGVYRPNHAFLWPESLDMAIGEIELTAGDELSPGETRVLPITFIEWPTNVRLTPGRQWRIQEGERLVGTCVIKEVLDSADLSHCF